jgi:hypothetical protein
MITNYWYSTERVVYFYNRIPVTTPLSYQSLDTDLSNIKEPHSKIKVKSVIINIRMKYLFLSYTTNTNISYTFDLMVLILFGKTFLLP